MFSRVLKELILNVLMWLCFPWTTGGSWQERETLSSFLNIYRTDFQLWRLHKHTFSSPSTSCCICHHCCFWFSVLVSPSTVENIARSWLIINCRQISVIELLGSLCCKCGYFFSLQNPQEKAALHLKIIDLLL